MQKNYIIAFCIGFIVAGIIIGAGLIIINSDGDGGTIDPGIELNRLIDNGFGDTIYTADQLTGIIEESLKRIEQDQDRIDRLSEQVRDTTGQLKIANGIIDGSIADLGEIIEGTNGITEKAQRAKRELQTAIENIQRYREMERSIQDGRSY